MILNVDFRSNSVIIIIKTFYMSQINPKIFLHNTTFSVQLPFKLPVTPFKNYIQIKS